MAQSTFGAEGLDPVTSAGADVQRVQVPMMEPLIWTKNAQMVPGIADRWELAADGLSWVFYLRKGIKFHNGDEVTAADVKFSIDRFTSKESWYAYLSPMVSRVEIVDAYTVRAYTAGPQPYLPTQLSMLALPSSGFVVPKTYIEKNGLDYFKQHPVGAGPFKFVRQVKGDRVEYEAVVDHYRQVPAFKKFVNLLVPEESTRVAMLKVGEVDVIEVGLDQGMVLEAQGFKVPNMAPTQIFVQLHGAYQPEGAKYPIADIRVRQALSLAINRDELGKTYFHGKFSAPTPPFVAEGSSDVDMAYWAKYGENTYRYDLPAAKQLMKDAGYAGGFNIKLVAAPMMGASDLPNLANIVSGYWSQLGIKTEQAMLDQGSYNAIRSSLKAPALIGQASLYSYAANSYTPKNLATGFGATGTFGLLGKAMPDVDKLLSDAQSVTDSTKRKEMLAQVIKKTTDSYVSLVMLQVPAVCAVGPRVDLALDKPTVYIDVFADIAKHRRQ